ncbi:MAG: 1-acyl-sn-glycerol-3-phosphate acyltransferase [Lachnospiraceae bacterium]|nr:1-acyl-sn-glycerol-3-phosphate acyltransferase [Lachnospiraceae bacterium]
MRIVLMFINSFFVLPYYFYKVWYHLRKAEKDRDGGYKWIHKVAGKVIKAGNVKVICQGQENIPKEDGFIFTPNHQGLFDSLCLLSTFDRHFSVISKKELENTPMLKWILTILGAFYMDREDIKQSMQVITEASKFVGGGRNLLIFPEGTRSKEGNKLGTFKAGAFKTATRNHAPIVPVALIDCYKPFDIQSIKKVQVQIHYLPPICYEEYKDMTAVEIATMVSERIQNKIDSVLAEANNVKAIA